MSYSKTCAHIYLLVEVMKMTTLFIADKTFGN